MAEYVCRITSAAMRAEPSHRSEMVSQLLLGERVEILDKNYGWVLVRSTLDSYTGWVDEVQLVPCNDEEKKGKLAVCQDLITFISDESTGESNWITFGALVELLEPGLLMVAGKYYRYRGEINEYIPRRESDFIMAAARKWLNAPYLWGGRTPLGVDCSGFVQLVYRSAGISLPRDAWQQAELGIDIPFAVEAREADLAFFENPDGRIIHVGILNGDGHIIHASGKVRIDAFDHQGIFNRESLRYTHKLKMIKRIV
ncbi:MAG: C40 family peptidase [Bacteroidales bacterium]